MTHAECAEDEIWVGNTHRESEQVRSLKSHGVASARMGDQAFDIEQKRLPKSQYAPVIISRSDHALYNDIMMRRTFGENWRR